MRTSNSITLSFFRLSLTCRCRPCRIHYSNVKKDTIRKTKERKTREKSLFNIVLLLLLLIDYSFIPAIRSKQRTVQRDIGFDNEQSGERVREESGHYNDDEQTNEQYRFGNGHYLRSDFFLSLASQFESFENLT